MTPLFAVALVLVVVFGTVFLLRGGGIEPYDRLARLDGDKDWNVHR